MNLHKEEHKIAKQSLTEALFLLMNEKPLSEITVTELIKKSGVARATYYRNYHSKEEIIHDFVNDLWTDFYQAHPLKEAADLFTLEQITATLDFFTAYQPFLITLHNSGLTALWMNDTNDYLMTLFPRDSLSSQNQLLIYAYVGAICNILFNWLTGSMTDRPEYLAKCLIDIFK